MWEIKKVTVDDNDGFKDDMGKVNTLLAEGYEPFQVTTVRAGGDTQWARHYIWLRKQAS